jgi:hypothetical protein
MCDDVWIFEARTEQAERRHMEGTGRVVIPAQSIVLSTAERKLGTHFELASGPSHLPDGPARPFGQWSQNFRCPVLVASSTGMPWGFFTERSA